MEPQEPRFPGAFPMQQRKPEQEGIGVLATLGAGFRLENDMLNAFEYIREKQPPSDPNFDVLEAAKTSTLWLDYSQTLARAQSQEEFDFISTKIERERGDRAALADQGLGGFAAGAVAGLFSPVMLIPLIGPARGAKGVGQAFGLAAVAATAAEVPLMANQLLRTNTEMGISIAAGTVLGGLLGSAAMMLRRSDFDRIASDLSPEQAAREASYIVRDGSGNVLRVGENVPLRMPEGIPVSPAAQGRITRFNAAAKQLGPVARAEGLEGLERLAKEPGATPALKELVAAVRAGTSVAAKSGRAAAAAGGSPSFVTAWQKLMAQAEKGEATTPQALRAVEKSRREITEALEAMGVRTEKEQAEFLARVQKEQLAARVPSVEAALYSALQAKSGPLLTRTVDEAPTPAPAASTAGAKARAEQFVLTVEEVAPDGTVRQVPLSELTEVGEMAPATIIGKIASFTSPILRSINQFDAPIISPVARRIAAMLSDNGVELRGNRFGLSPSPEGTVEARMGFYQSRLAAAYEAQQKAYNKYITGKEDLAGGERISQTLRMEFGRSPQGKMNWLEFKREVADAMNRADQSEIPEVAQAASAIRKEFYNPINEAAREAADFNGVRKMYDELEGNPDTSYFTHQFSPELVGGLRQQFIADVGKHYNDTMSAVVTRMIIRERERMAAEADYEAILRMDKATAEEALLEAQTSLKAKPDPSSIDPRYDRITELRDRARELREEEFDRLAAEKREDYLADPDNKKGLERLARENVQDEVDRLRSEANLLESQLSPAAVTSKAERSALRKRIAAINRSFGRVEAKRRAALDKIERNEELNLNALDRIVSQSRRFLASMSRLTDKKLDEEFQKLLAQTDKMHKTVGKTQDRVRKLEELEEFAPEEKLLFEKGRLAVQEAAVAKKARKAGDALFFDRDAARAQVKEQLDETLAAVNKLNNKRAERNATLRANADELTPERVAGELALRRSKSEKRGEDLEDYIRSMGATDINVRTGGFSFAEISEELATKLAHRITGNYTRVAQLDMMPELRGPMKHRLLNMPYDTKKKYLERDTEIVLARYARTMGSDIELFRAFGSVDGAKALQVVREDLDRIDALISSRTVDEKGVAITDKRRKKEQEQHARASKRRMNELTGSIERIRTLRGMPDDATAIPYRLGRLFMNMNVATMMGSAMITSIPDAGRSVMAHGLMKTFGDSWMPFVSSLVDEGQKEANAAVIRQLRLAAVGIDVFTNQRARGIFDLDVDPARMTKFEKFFEYTAHKMPQVALYGQWTDANKTLTGFATMARILTTTADVAGGSVKQADLLTLSRAGISPQMAMRIQAQMEQTGTRYKNTIIPNTEAWDDYQALRVFQAALSHEDARMVITPGLERPLWMDASMLGRIVGQFRSFTMAANTKMLISGLQSRDMAALHTLQGAMFSLALGTVSYYLWATTAGGKAKEEMLNATWETWLDQAIYRSGLLGAYSEAQVIGSSIPLTQPYTTFANKALAGRRASSIMGAVAGPSFGKAENIASFIAQLDDPTENTVSQARKLIPYQNVFYLRQALTSVEEGINSVFNIPERRQ